MEKTVINLKDRYVEDIINEISSVPSGKKIVFEEDLFEIENFMKIVDFAHKKNMRMTIKTKFDCQGPSLLELLKVVSCDEVDFEIFIDVRNSKLSPEKLAGRILLLKGRGYWSKIFIANSPINKVAINCILRMIGVKGAPIEIIDSL